MIARHLAFACGLLLAVIPRAASAHVRVTPASVSPGSTATLTFRCPTERSDSPTVKLAIELPEDVPLANVTVPPLPGWHSTVTKRGAVVATVTWEGGSIPPGSAGLFPIVAGPIPAGSPLLFRAVQTYGNGAVVRWIQARAPGEPEPPFPAPVVNVR